MGISIKSDLPDEAVISIFAFEFSQGEGERKYRSEVKAHGLTEAVEEIRLGTIPNRFPWLKRVIEDEVETGRKDVPSRFMAVARALIAAQQTPSRDISQELQITTLGRLLTGVPDGDGNLMGFCLQLQTEGGDQRHIIYGNLEINPKDGMWWVKHEWSQVHFPLADVTDVIPGPKPGESQMGQSINSEPQG